MAAEVVEAVVCAELSADGAKDSDTSRPTRPDLGSADETEDRTEGASNAVTATTCLDGTIDDSNEEDILEVENQDTLKKAPEEVIILSSDSEGEECERKVASASKKRKEVNKVENSQTKEDNDTSVQVIKELPYSYMNRSRGPKTAFLQTLLQQTNRDIQRGRKITDNTYQQIDLPLPTFPATARKPQIQEVTLSSDEDDMETTATPSTSAASNDSNGQGAKGTPGTDDIDSALRADSPHTAAPTPTPATEGVEGDSPVVSSVPIASGSGLSRKRSHAGDKLPNGKGSCTGATPKINQRARTTHVQSSGRKSTNALLRARTEQMLAAETERVKKLGEEEVDLDDEENSSFLQSRRLKEKIANAFKVFCQTGNLSTKVGRPIETQIKLSNNLSEFPEIEKAVEKFVNSLKRGMSPDFAHIMKVVEDAVEEGNYPALQPQDILSLAKKLFKDAIMKIRKRRAMDSWKSGFAQDVSSVFQSANPPEIPQSPELAAQLEESDRLKRSEEAQLDHFTQQQQELEQTNPQALEDDCDSIKSDDSGEEEEDEGNQDHNADVNAELVNGNESPSDNTDNVNDGDNPTMDTRK